MATKMRVVADEERSTWDGTAGLPDSPTPKVLRNEILKYLTDSVVDNKRFVSAEVLDKAFTLESIESCLGAFGMSPSWQAELARFIHGSAKKTFAILVLIGKVPEIERFREEGFTDEMLPVGYEVTDDVWTVRSYQSNYDSLDPDSEWKRFRQWDKATIYDFCDRQWMVLAPVFTTDRFEQFLHRDTILPFTAVADEVKSSYFSKVYRMKLHEAHLTPYQSRVAVKELHDLEAYSREVVALAHVKDINHPHLIQSIAAFRRGGKQYVLFPWADGGNLRDFWLSTPTEESNYARTELVGWTLKQIVGLANGLSELHRHSYRHGDVKPENILRFRSESHLGTLVITDMGLSKIHRMSTICRDNATGTRAATPRYEPPEAILSNGKPRSRKYDIWAMGCIIMEFITWFLHGPGALNRFSAYVPSFRKAIAQPNSVAVVHDNVRKWMECLREDGWCRQRTALGDLLKLVESRLLVVDTRRTTSAELSRALVDITQRANFDRQYLSGHPGTNQERSTRSRCGGASSFLTYITVTPKDLAHFLSDGVGDSGLDGPAKSSHGPVTESRRRCPSGEQQDTHSDKRTMPHRRKSAADSTGEAKGATRVHKRKGTGDDEYDDQDDDDGRIIKRTKWKREGQSQDQKFACPLYKKNPALFQNQRTCCGPGWPTVHRVKEHIYRSHALPDGRCPRCLNEFPDSRAYDRHIRQEERCEIREDDSKDMFIDKAVEAKLRKKGPRTLAHPKISEPEKWTEMFKVMFPDYLPVPSPYYENDVKDARRVEPIREYVSFASRMMRHEVAVILGRSSLSEDIRSEILGGLESCHTRAYRQFVRQTKSRNEIGNGIPNSDGCDRRSLSDLADDADVPSQKEQEGNSQEEGETCTEINTQPLVDQAILGLDSIDWVGDQDAVDPVSGMQMGTMDTTGLLLPGDSLPLQNLSATPSSIYYHRAYQSMPTPQPSHAFDFDMAYNGTPIVTCPTPYYSANFITSQPSAIPPMEPGRATHLSSQAALAWDFAPQTSSCGTGNLPPLRQTQIGVSQDGVRLGASGSLGGDMDRQVFYRNRGNAFSTYGSPGLSSAPVLFDSGYNSAAHQERSLMRQ